MTDAYVPAALKQYWWLLLVLGLASLALGIALIFWPGRTITIALVIIGIYLLVFGVIRFAAALFDSSVDRRWLEALLGIVGVVFGLIVIRQPVDALGLVVLLVGLFWIISGFVETYRGITHRELPDRGWRTATGVISIIAGAVLLLWPSATVTVLAIIAGIIFAVSGISEIGSAFRLKNA